MPDAPKLPDAPKMDFKMPDAPKAPSFDMPKFDAPKMDAPKFDMPKFDAPKMDAPKMDMPSFSARISAKLKLSSPPRLHHGLHAIDATPARRRGGVVSRASISQPGGIRRERTS
tara:strand:- start:3 stop:344 length:342 start_codon:yes stop_codon:yes gene_type:complete